MATRRVSRSTVVAVVIALLVGAVAVPASAFSEGGLVLLSSHSFTWVDLDSGGQVRMTENVYEGCLLPDGTFQPHDMTFEYVVDNTDYDPYAGYSNGFSGFQVLFPQEVPELYNQQSPTIGGPWQQNAFSGQAPPWGVEWDVPLPNLGIMPGETGTFSYCTYEREDVVVESEGSGGGPAGWAHSWGIPVPEPIVDLDGTVSELPGDADPYQEVAVLGALTGWPAPGAQDVEGIDWFDNDGNCIWSDGDDIHVEGSAYPAALRDALHDDSDSYLDPLVLDIDLSLWDGQPVDVDLETGSDFSDCAGGPNAGPDPVLKFHDADGSGNWDDGEDIVLDANLDSIFGEVVNIQTNTFHGYQSVPGPLLNELATDACSAGNEVCKKVKYSDDDGDGIIEVGEPVEFLEVIQVHNPTDADWSDVVVADRFGAEIAVDSADPSVGTVVLTTKGKSEKVFLTWDIGDLGAGETANLVLRTRTDQNPAGQQSYSECSWHEYNSGAVLKVRDADGKQASFETGEVMVSVLTEDLEGDCDGDGHSDARELEAGTDPHDPLDFPI